MLPYVFTETSLTDIFKHTAFFEKQQEGLGLRFMNAVELAAAEISVLPTGYASYYKATRERGLKKFPYKLIYTIEFGII